MLHHITPSVREQRHAVFLRQLLVQLVIAKYPPPRAAPKVSLGTPMSTARLPLSFAVRKMAAILARVAELGWARKKSLPPMLTITSAGLYSCKSAGKRAKACALVSPETPAFITRQPLKRAKFAGHALCSLAPTPCVIESPRATTTLPAGSGRSLPLPPQAVIDSATSAASSIA